MPVEKITVEEFMKMFENVAKTMIENEKYLSDLDRIGDADFGVNISTGFRVALERIRELPEPDIGTILITAGRAFVLEVGATLGGLLGRAFRAAGREYRGRKEIDAEDVVRIIEIILDTIKKVGGAKVGDKTMVDALEPAAIAARKCLDSGVRDIVKILEEATKAAEEGMKATINMVAKVGRASYLGERTLGHQDAGATAIYLMFKSALETVKGFEK